MAEMDRVRSREREKNREKLEKSFLEQARSACKAVNLNPNDYAVKAAIYKIAKASLFFHENHGMLDLRGLPDYEYSLVRITEALGL